MEWRDNALIIHQRPYGEQSGIVTVLTSQQGSIKGLLRPLLRKGQSVVERGDAVIAVWRGRLPEHLGYWSFENKEKRHFFDLMHKPFPLLALTLMCEWMEKLLPSHHPYPDLYQTVLSLIEGLKGPEWAKAYCQFEYTLLCALGYGLDLTHCVVTGQTHDLVYISPRSGRAVSALAGAPYHNKLFSLSPLLQADEKTSSPTAVMDALKVTGYFLNRYLLAPYGKIMPNGRDRLLKGIGSE